MNVINFEVYAFNRERGWVLHARFPGQEREEAMAEAREVERMGMRARVSREVYNTEENSYEETDIYVGRTPEAPPAASGGKRSPANRGIAGVGAPPLSLRSLSKSKKGKAESEPARINVQTVSLAAFIVLVGVLTGLLTLHFLPAIINLAWKLGYRLSLDAESYDSLINMSFIASFLAVVVPLTLMLWPKMFSHKVKATRETEQQVVRRQTQEVRQQKIKESLNDLSRQALMEETAFDAPTLDDYASDAAADAPEDPPPPDISPANEPVPDDADATLAATEAAVKLRTFVDSAINAIKNTKTQLDNYNKFALHLYIAGSVEVLGNNRNLVAAECRQLTAKALSNLGINKEMANQFYDKVNDYKSEERYYKMVEYGRSAMDDFLKGAEASAHSQLTGAIQEWSRGAVDQAGSPIITVMFTDMVGSTDMTQDRGDVAAQEIVRRHNTIVRMAISQYGGKEIKHTGDGIMASFDDCTNAVDASVSIQRNVNNHNKVRPDQPLLLRIGLNAGKPIQEENDIFGATVQLAARVCAATKPEQTLCTESVIARCRGRAEFISPVGKHDLKGFKEPIELYEIRW